jgi:hypothetical protein
MPWALISSRAREPGKLSRRWDGIDEDNLRLLATLGVDDTGAPQSRP